MCKNILGENHLGNQPVCANLVQVHQDGSEVLPVLRLGESGALVQDHLGGAGLPHLRHQPGALSHRVGRAVHLQGVQGQPGLRGRGVRQHPEGRVRRAAERGAEVRLHPPHLQQPPAVRPLGPLRPVRRTVVGHQRQKVPHHVFPLRVRLQQRRLHDQRILVLRAEGGISPV